MSTGCSGRCGKLDMGIGLSTYTLAWPNGATTLFYNLFYSRPEPHAIELTAGKPLPSRRRAGWCSSWGSADRHRPGRSLIFAQGLLTAAPKPIYSGRILAHYRRVAGRVQKADVGNVSFH